MDADSDARARQVWAASGVTAAAVSALAVSAGLWPIVLQAGVKTARGRCPVCQAWTPVRARGLAGAHYPGRDRTRPACLGTGQRLQALPGLTWPEPVPPDLGAARTAELLTARTGIEVEATTVAELGRRRLLTIAGQFRDRPLYHGTSVAAFAARPDAAELIGAAARDGVLHTTDEAVAYLRIRRSDLDRLTTAGLLCPADGYWSPHRTGARAPWCPLYRRADLDALLADPRIDWPGVRATEPGRRAAGLIPEGDQL